MASGTFRVAIEEDAAHAERDGQVVSATRATSEAAKPQANPRIFTSSAFWLRAAVFTCLINSTLFFRGCSLDSSLDLTGGFPAPAIEFNSQPGSFELLSVDWKRFATNFAICIAGCMALAVAARGLFLSRSFAIGLALTYFAFNLLLVAPELWAKTEFRLQIWLLDSMFKNERRLWVMDIYSRSYFAAHVVICGCVTALSRRMWTRHIATSRDRWWQFGLTGVFALMTIACLLTALALAVFSRS